MLFNSEKFLIFFPIVVFIYFIIPKKIKYFWLLIASYYFYMCWNVKYALLIAFSTLVTYISGILIEKFQVKDKLNENKKKVIVIICCIINIGILFFFKYFNFTVDNINAILSNLNLNNINKSFDIILPVGISFYTFQALSYTIDVYRGEIQAEYNFFKYALFVSFFPQLVAGPIERSKNLLNDINEIPNNSNINYGRITNGIIVMIWGYFLKMVIADKIAKLVNTVFNDYNNYGSLELCIASIAFAIQIYCDFYSYSTIAIGSAQVMGFTLMENFNSPYLASSIKEFWRRWHISLSTWLKDYLYIPLGGNRCSSIRNYINIMITFLISGLWHGAAWNYIIWGGLHGIYQVIGQLIHKIMNRGIRIPIKKECISYKIFQIIRTFILVDFAWIFFRFNSFNDAVKFILRIFNYNCISNGFYNMGLDTINYTALVIAIFILLCVDLVKYLSNCRVDTFLQKQNLWFKWGVLIIIINMIFVFGEYGTNVTMQPFIYFQF